MHAGMSYPRPPAMSFWWIFRRNIIKACMGLRALLVLRDGQFTALRSAYNELTFITVSSVVRTEVNIMLESNVGHKNIEQSPERRIIAHRRTAARSLRPDAPGRDPDPRIVKKLGRERHSDTHV